MWTFYANKHSGICIEFRVRDEHEESHLDFVASALPIEYADRCPLINLVQDDPAEIVRKTLLTKATPFSYEAEWRIVRYDDGPDLKPIPKGIITAIIFGVNIDQSARQRIIQACADYDGRVEIMQAQLDPQAYGLHFELDRIVKLNRCGMNAEPRCKNIATWQGSLLHLRRASPNFAAA